MSVSVPHVPALLHERTRAWAQEHGAELVGLVPVDDAHYWRWLANEWSTSGDTVIVEQDIVPAPGVVDDMLTCPQSWCASPYLIAGDRMLAEGLGCTKFSARLKVEHPDLLERVGLIEDDLQPARSWRRLDTRIARVLTGHGYMPHEHAVSEHLHDYRTRP